MRDIQDMLLNGINLMSSTSAEYSDWSEKVTLAQDYMSLRYYLNMLENHEPAWHFQEIGNTKFWQFPYFKEGDTEGSFWYSSHFADYMFSVFLNRNITSGKYVANSLIKNPRFKPSDEMKVRKGSYKSKDRAESKIEEMKNQFESWYPHYKNYFRTKEKYLIVFEKKMRKLGFAPADLFDFREYQELRRKKMMG